MIEVTLRTLNTPNFHAAIVRLNNERGLDAATTYRVGKLAKLADIELTKGADKDDDWIKEYELAGKLKLEKLPDGQLHREWLDKDAEQEYIGKKEALLDAKVQLKVSKLAFKSIKGLSGVELIAIEEILEGLPQEA